MRDYGWPRSGTPLSDVVMGQRDLPADEWEICLAARRRRSYLGRSVIFRDPDLTPHIPARAR